MGGAIPSAISFEAIDNYAARFGPHDLDDLQRFVALIGAIENEYLQQQYKKRK